jgi:hypothetical protein
MIARWAFEAEDRPHRCGIAIEDRWIPSHIGIDGNQEADAAAKRAASHRYEDRERCTELQCHAIDWASVTHINRLATETQSRITKEWIQAMLDDDEVKRGDET